MYKPDAMLLKPVGAGIVNGILLGAQLLMMKAIGLQGDAMALTWGFLLACNLCLCFWLTINKGWPKVIAGLDRWRQWGTVGVVNGIMTYLTLVGVNMSGAANAGVLLRTDLLFGLILGYLLYKETAGAGELAGGAIMLAGVWLVMDIAFQDVGLHSLGDVYLLLVGLLLAVNATIIKYGLRTVWGPAIAFFNSFSASFFLLVVLLVTGRWSALLSLGNPACLAGAAAVGVMEALVLLAYYYSLARFPIWIARAFGLLSPVAAIGGSWWLFGETIHIRQGCGFVLALAGMSLMLVQRGRRIAAARRQESGAQPVNG